MKIYSMGDGTLDEAVDDLKGKPCIVLLCDSRTELSDALRDIRFRDAVTVVKRVDQEPSAAAGDASKEGT